MQHNPYQAPSAEGAVDDGDICTKMHFFSWGQRIGRLRYFAYSMGIYFIFMVAMGVVGGILGGVLGSGGESALMAFVVIAYIPMVIGMVALGVRRLHDLDKSGWLWLVLLIPIVNIILTIYMMFFPGTSATNRFGPRPMPNTALTWIGGLVAPIVFIGILAAVAIPAYQDYVQRAAAAGQFNR